MASNTARDDFGFKITKHFGVISTSRSGWTKELNLVSWNSHEPKLDIREWDETHLRMSRGITLTTEEMKVIIKLIDENGLD